MSLGKNRQSKNLMSYICINNIGFTTYNRLYYPDFFWLKIIKLGRVRPGSYANSIEVLAKLIALKLDNRIDSIIFRFKSWQ